MSFPLNIRCFAIPTVVCFLAASIAAPPALAGAPERWVCDIELGQGNAGRLVLNRTLNDIDGSLTMPPGVDAAPLTTTIKGSWSSEVIRFIQAGAPTGQQPFMGIAITTGPQTSKMAGRFAREYEGVWSATCSVEQQGDVGGPVTPEPPVTPPTRPPSAPTCTISGSAVGPRASLANLYQVLLRGPNSTTRVAGRRPFGSGQFSFANLPDGIYLLTIDTKADVSVQITPRSHQITCGGAAMADKNFEFR